MIDPALGFDVVLYRGAIVGSLNGWIADVKARGGVVTQVPSGFWHGLKAARFGALTPFVYELPPVWLLVSDGVDTATYEFLDLVNYSGVAEYADNQVQGVADVVKQGAGLLDFAFAHVLDILILVLVLVAAVYLAPVIARGARELTHV